MKSNISLSIILPTYNESENIVALIKALDSKIKKLLKSYTFIIVDDNSPDHTAQIVKKQFANNPKIKVYVRKNARGLATAAIYGINKARTSHVLFMATDFNHHPKYLTPMVKLITKNPVHIISGSRFLPGGGMARKDHFYGSLIMNTIGRLILRTPITDYTGVYLLFSKTHLQDLPKDWIFQGHGEWGIRLLYLLHLKGKTITEVPVFYPHRPAGESKTIRSTYAFKLLKAFRQTKSYGSSFFT